MDPSFITALVTGPLAGFAVTLYLLVETRKDLKQERTRNQEFGDAFLALAAETNIHLKNAPDSVKSLYEVVSHEHEATREVVKTKADEIKNAIL